MVKDKIKEALDFQPLTADEKKDRHILGRLYGPCASIINPTRNDRMYKEELWDRVFESNAIINEWFENGGIPMELDHPEERTETKSTQIAAIMSEKPKKDKDGHLICYVDILDTPCGNIAYTMAKYGFKWGISSRGTGDIVEDVNGDEIVDPETYDFTTFDLVLLPAVKDARLTLAEGLDTKLNSCKKELNEKLSSASEEDRAVMEEALSRLNFDYSSEKADNKLLENDTNSNKVQKTDVEATDGGTADLVKNLQEAMLAKSNLEAKVLELQNLLAVGDSKVTKLQEELKNYKDGFVVLSTMAKDKKKLAKKCESLELSIKEKCKLIEEKEQQISTDKSKRIKRLVENNQNITHYKRAAEEQINLLQEKLKTANAQNNKKDETLKSLEESLQKANEQLKTVNAKCEKDLKEAIKAKEAYLSVAQKTMDRYIGFRANILGVEPEDIKNRLNESYSLKDIDAVCESLQDYELKMSALPFKLSANVKAKVKTPTRPSTSDYRNNNDDEIDDTLIRMAENLKN